jgi:predicted dehydrogenase
MVATWGTRLETLRDRDDERTCEPVRIGLIGTGLGARIHLPALAFLPEVEVVSICSRHEDRASLLASEYGIPTHVTEFRAVARDPEVEAVIVASPPHLHHPMTLAALEAGKHVLCEKPMARNLAEARDMVKLVDRVGVTAMVNHQLRFLPVRARIKELIEEDYLGEPHAATVTVHRSSLNDPFDRPFGWLMEQDKAGGMLGATGSHHVDALRWWFGEVKAVAGATTTMVKRRRLPESSTMAKVDADDNFAILLKFGNGALGTIHVSATTAFEGDEEVSLSGSRGTLRVRDGRLLGARVGEVSLSELPIPERLEGDLPAFDHFLTQPTALLLRSWVRAIRFGDPASPSFADGVKVQELLDAVARSSAQGRWIDTSGARWPMGAAV